MSSELIKKDTDVNDVDIKGTIYSVTALWQAAILGNIEMVELLSEKGADVNTKNNLGMTPLHVTSRSGREDTVELFIAEGANVNLKNNAGLRTPLDITKRGNNNEINELLKRYGAKE